MSFFTENELETCSRDFVKRVWYTGGFDFLFTPSDLACGGGDGSNHHAPGLKINSKNSSLYVTSVEAVMHLRQHLAGWKASSLSIIARVTLVKLVLSALRLYYMSIFVILKGFLK
ncbi:hypothetical protein GQ457_17G012580 [Hibiscus cannabinus]